MEGKKRGWRDGTCAPGTELKRGGVPTSWEAPSDPRGQKGSFRGSEESTTPICGGQETPAQTGVLLPCAPAWDMCPLVRQGLQLRGERAVQKRTAAGCVDKAWRGWSVLRPQLGVLAEAPLLSGTQREPLSPRPASASAGSRRAHLSHCLGGLTNASQCTQDGYQQGPTV